jgi:hypothetical protein
LASADIKQFQHGNLSKDQCLTNDNTINTITQYIRHIPLDAYSMGQKSLHQNFKYWGAHIQNSPWKVLWESQVKCGWS